MLDLRAIGKFTEEVHMKTSTKKVQIRHKGNSKVIVLTKESQGTMYYRGQ